MHVWYGDGPDAPRSDPQSITAAAGAAGVTRVTLGWMVELPTWLGRGAVDIRTVLAGYALAKPVNDGLITPLDVRLSAVPSMIRQDPPDVAVVSGVRRGHDLAFGSAVGWNDILARHANRVVVEVDETGEDLGAPLIEGDIVATIDRPAASDPTPVSSRPANDVDLAIGESVASILPDGATLQFGPGGIGEGIARSITHPVRLWTGLLTDTMAALADRELLRGVAVAAYAWGGSRIQSLAAAGRLELASCSRTHDLTAMSNIDRFVACNTALQVDLGGNVNVSTVGGRVIAAVGGHADFCVGASRSTNGLSIIAVRSTTSRGASVIVPHVDAVSTPGHDIDVVVTEHGIADLRGVPTAWRSDVLRAVAAPEHRGSLT